MESCSLSGPRRARGEVAKGSTGRGDKIVGDHNDFTPATAADIGRVLLIGRAIAFDGADAAICVFIADGST